MVLEYSSSTLDNTLASAHRVLFGIWALAIKNKYHAFRVRAEAGCLLQHSKDGLVALVGHDRASACAAPTRRSNLTALLSSETSD